MLHQKLFFITVSNFTQIQIQIIPFAFRSPYNSFCSLLSLHSPPCTGEMTPASPPCQGVSRVSQSDLSCWMPHGRLFVKPVCSVCSRSPPCPRWQRSHCEPEGLCFVSPCYVGPQRAHTHLCSLWNNACWLTLFVFNSTLSIISDFRKALRRLVWKNAWHHLLLWEEMEIYNTFLSNL